MYIKDGEKVWIICQKCDTPMRPGTTRCKCPPGQGVQMVQDRRGATMIIEDGDSAVIDNER